MQKIRKNGSTFLIALIILALTVSCTNKDREKIPGRPNLILIMADDLGYSDLRCYGSENINTPNIDQLASEGMRFTDYHSNGAVCSPTRAALISGKYQQRVGIEGVLTAARHRDKGLAPGEITLAEALKTAGYTTGMFGKWHLGYAEKYNPTHQGFDEFRGYVSGNVDYFAHIDQEGYFDWWENTELKDDRGYSTDLLTRYAIDFIKTHKDDLFFLYLPYEAPHYPYQNRNGKPFRKIGKKMAHDTSLRKENIPGIYKEMVEILDEDIGKILRTLKELNLTENTLIFFCSDNGGVKNYGKHNYPLRGWKAQIYEGGHRVPAIAFWPGKIKPGTRSDETIMSFDIYPTFIDLAHVTTRQALDGISFKGVLLNNEILPGRSLFWKLHHAKAIRKADWKLIMHDAKTPGPGIELYNLKTDISESVNLADKNPDMTNILSKELNEWEKTVGKNQ